MRQRSKLQKNAVRGQGWTVGPYATVRLTDKLFWQGRAAWGRSGNDASPLQTYTDEFGTDRRLLSSTLAGRLARGPWLVRPSVSVAYLRDAMRSYSDSFGVVIPEVTSHLGQARVGPQVEYHYQFSPRVALEPRAGLQVISNFAGTTAASGVDPIDGANTGPVGVRGRAEFGVRVIGSSGFGLDLSGTYDGIGATDYPAFGGQVMVRVPLK
jgi:hypothetical protein